MNIKDYQKEVDRWITTVGVRYFSELTNMAILTEEVGEVARLMSRMYGEQSFKDNIDQTNIKKQLADELADVLFVVTCLANQTGIDLTKAMQNNMNKKSVRDGIRHKGNKKLSG